MSDDLEPIGAPPPEPVTKVRADALERAETAWAARVRGRTWEDAAALAGYANGQNAMRACRTVFGILPELDRDEARRLWRDRLDWLWEQTVTHVEDREAGALTSGVRIAQAAARLDGLDAPVVYQHDPSLSELHQWVAEVMEVRDGPLAVEADIFEAEVIEGTEQGR